MSDRDRFIVGILIAVGLFVFALLHTPEIMILLFYQLPAMVIRRLLRRRADEDLDDDVLKSGRCRNCGFLLHGLTENRCPECGTPFGADRAKRETACRRARGGDEDHG